MGYFAKIVRYISILCSNIGNCFLVLVTLLIFGDVIYRFFGKAITGSYELTQVAMYVIVGFGMVNAGMQQAHVVIDIITMRFSKKNQAIAEGFAYFLSFVVWGLISGSIFWVFTERGLFEDITIMLKVPLQPFRYTWAIGLGILSLLFLTEFYRALYRGLHK